MESEETCHQEQITIKSKLPAWIELPDDVIADEAVRQLGETSEKIILGLAAMRAHIQKYHLNCFESDEFLLMFLRVKKFRQEDSCKHLERFIWCMENAYKRYGPINPTLTENVLQKCRCTYLPYRDLNKRLIMVYRMGNSDDVHWLESAKTAIFGLLHLMYDQSSQTCGINLIIDGQNTCIEELVYANSYGMALFKLMDGVPFRIGRIDVVNSSKLFRLCYFVVKPFLPRKLSERLVLHAGCAESLRKSYDMTLIPEEFGGTGGQLSNAHWATGQESSIDRIIDLQRRIIGY